MGQTSLWFVPSVENSILEPGYHLVCHIVFPSSDYAGVLYRTGKRAPSLSSVASWV